MKDVQPVSKISKVTMAASDCLPDSNAASSRQYDDVENGCWDPISLEYFYLPHLPPGPDEVDEAAGTPETCDRGPARTPAAAAEIHTARSLARCFQVSPRTILAWARRGLIPCLRPTSKTVRFILDEVIEAMRAGPRPLITAADRYAASLHREVPDAEHYGDL